MSPEIIASLDAIDVNKVGHSFGCLNSLLINRSNPKHMRS